MHNIQNKLQTCSELSGHDAASIAKQVKHHSADFGPALPQHAMYVISVCGCSLLYMCSQTLPACHSLACISDQSYTILSFLTLNILPERRECSTEQTAIAQHNLPMPHQTLLSAQQDSASAQQG